MPKYLVVVESPAKAKTISKYLGKDYGVQASIGHVRDLPAKSLSVDIEQGFAPVYQIVKGKDKVIGEIRAAAEKSELVYLATDPDREGEAIAWHVAEAAHIARDKTCRVSFHQVTKAAVQEAIAQPRDLDDHLIDAQQARRVLDRLVGYKVSPLLSKSMRKPLSAGRVQSIALRLVVDREREILAFVPVEYWTLEAELQRQIGEREHFFARLVKIKGVDVELHNEGDVRPILAALENASYVVTRVERGQRRQNPPPPFVTSSLQAEAGRKLHFSPRETMRTAQELYEGIDLDGERVGLITYMRTDSTQVAPEAQAEARAFIAKRWGANYRPAKPPFYRSKVALAQEAHEAIRPTSVFREPDAIRAHLMERQARLYELIWRRFLASQMSAALYATMSVDVLAAQDYLFRATGSTLLFPGYLAVYSEARDEDEGEERAQALPPLEQGEAVDLVKLLPEQHFTKPPARYSEPTLIKALEAHGVGRPSTYATIVSIIQDRNYVIKERGKLRPTDLGMVVCDALVATFADIMDIGYTASMEEQLDHIAAGALGYVDMLRSFYTGFEPQVEAAKQAMPEALEKALWTGLSAELRAQTCPQCGRPLQARLSNAGRFLGCMGYPDCRYILDLSNPQDPSEPQEQFAEGETCELCGGRMRIISRGRNKFLGCEHYPTCKNTRAILSDKIKQLATETACPQCQLKPLQAKKGRYGEYLHCPQCNKNHSLKSLGLAVVKSKAPRAAPELADIPCPECSQRPLEKRVGRFGPYYRCLACRKNFAEKKLQTSNDGSEET